MKPNRSIPDSGVIPELAYRDVAAAVRWLSHAFGFHERLRIGDHRAQLLISLDPGGGAVVVMDRSHETDADMPPSGHGILVRVRDVDAHFATASAAGAEIEASPQTHPFGERQYSARDLDGHRWTFSQTVADVDPATWGGTLKVPR